MTAWCIPNRLVINYREWGGGGLQNGKGEHMKFYPYEKEVGKGSFSHVEGAHNNFFGSFYAVALSISHNGEGGFQSLQPLKRRPEDINHCSSVL